jgi:hypothetical protein
MEKPRLRATFKWPERRNRASRRQSNPIPSNRNSPALHLHQDINAEHIRRIFFVAFAAKWHVTLAKWKR